MTSETIQKLELLLEASKGGNVRGVTEDHRYEMLLASSTAGGKMTEYVVLWLLLLATCSVLFN